MFRKRNISKSSISAKSSGTWTTDHFMQCGEFIARMDNSLKTFSHKAYESRSVIPKKNMRWIQKIYNHSIWLRFRNSIWFLSSIPEVKNFIRAVEDEGRKKLVRKDEKMSSLSSSSSNEYRWWRLWTSSATPFCLWSISWNRFGWAAWDQKFYETANVMFKFFYLSEVAIKERTAEKCSFHH